VAVHFPDARQFEAVIGALFYLKVTAGYLRIRKKLAV
jgi:hypothetical protein